MNAGQRTALYIAAGSIISLISVYGIFTEEQSAAILAVVNGLLGVLMAFTAVTHIKPDTSKDEVPVEEPPAPTQLPTDPPV